MVRPSHILPAIQLKVTQFNTLWIYREIIVNLSWQGKSRYEIMQGLRDQGPCTSCLFGLHTATIVFVFPIIAVWVSVASLIVWNAFAVVATPLIWTAAVVTVVAAYGCNVQARWSVSARLERICILQALWLANAFQILERLLLVQRPHKFAGCSYTNCSLKQVRTCWDTPSYQ